MKIWPIRFRLSALLVGALAAVSAFAQITPPYVVDFETGDGYTLGNLAAQDGWTVPQGDAAITNSLAFSGTFSVGLLTTSGPAKISQTFTSFTGGNITYLDFWARPTVSPAQPASTTVTVEGSLFSLVRLDDSGHLIALDGDGSGGGHWVPTGHVIALDSNGRASSWVRFTVRQNYTTKKWDLYVDGAIALHNLGLRNSSQTHLAQFAYLSSSLTNAYLDGLYVASVNPLFTDADGDGMADSWETSHGLSAATNERDADLDGDGLTNIEEYVLVTNPNAADTDNDGLPDHWELQYGSNPLVADHTTDPGEVGRTLLQSYTNTLSPWPTPTVASGLRAWYRADKGIIKDGSNKVSQWRDVSGNTRNAGQPAGSAQPTWNSSALNSLPTITFGSGSVLTTGLIDLQAASTDLSVVMVLKPAATQTTNAALLDLSQDNTSGFAVYQRTGLPNTYALEWSPATGQWTGGAQTAATVAGGGQVVSFVKNGTTHTSYLNGTAAASGTVSAAMITPLTALSIGGHGDSPATNYFAGEIAEILVYNRALTPVERSSIEAALKTKYAILDLNGDDDGDGLTNAQEFGFGTNPQNADTDGDGLSDGQEVALGTNPLVADLDQVPAHITGRILHLKADASVTMDGSGNVSAWGDGSGASNHALQATGAEQPLWMASAVNGGPAMRFDGSNDNLRLPDTLETGLTAVETFLVLKGTEEQNTNRKPFDFGGASSGIYGVLYTTAGQIRDDTGSTTSHAMGDPSLALDQWRLYNTASAPGSYSAWMDGGLIYQSDTNTVGFRSGGFYIGKGNDGYPFLGDIAEILVYDHALTALQREAVTRYLALKYALSVTAAAAPTAVSAQAVGSTKASVLWTPGTNGKGVIYEIERRTGSGAYAKIGSVTDSSGYLDTGLAAETAYTYRVRARTPSAQSGYSGEASVTTLGATETDLPTSGVRLWLAADTGLVRSDLERVGYWPDQSGLHNDAIQYTPPTQQPLWVANAVNGRPAVRFDGSNDYLRFPDTMEDGLTAVETFLVLKGTEEQNVNRKPFDFGGASSGIWGLLYTTLGQIRDDTGSTTSHVIGDPTLPLNQWRLYNIASESGHYAGWLDGNKFYESFTNTVGFRSGGFYIGKGNDGYPFLGDIAEVIVYDHPLTEPERNAVFRYLTLKYALAISQPVTPVSLTAKAVSTTQVNLTWVPGAAGAGVFYSVERRLGSGAYAQLPDLTDSGGYLDSNLSPGASYTYRVRTRTPLGYSGYSTEITVTLPTLATDLPTTGLRLWLKADSGVVRADQEQIALWPDQSGGNNHASSSATAQRPLWVASALNGRPAVRFDGSDDFLQLPDTLETGLSAIETFIVLKGTEEQNVNRKPFDFGGASSGIWGVLYTTLGQIRDDTGSTTSHVVGDPSLPLDQWRIYNSLSRAGEFAAWLDGGLIYQSFTNTVGFRASGFFIGKGNDGYPFLGDIAEVIVYDHPLSPLERETVTRYLGLKYGLVSGLVDNTSSLDANGDGLVDSVNNLLGINPHNLDVDGDGVSNLVERAQGTNPFIADTDGDGVSDGADAFPLDPTRWAAPSGTPGDVTPPVITLTKPANATPSP